MDSSAPTPITSTDPEPDPIASSGFDELCRSLSPRLVGSLTLQTGDRSRAEDVAQEALARAWLRWDEVAAMANPNGWVFTVAFNLAKSGRRRQGIESRANLRSVGGAETVGTDADVADRLALDGALRQMPNRQRSVIALRYYAGFSVAETAQVMGCAEGTVKSLTSAALQKLRSILRVDLPLDAPKGTAP
jgi:RNA polymerase sigma-70 factor (sigma-E family)